MTAALFWQVLSVPAPAPSGSSCSQRVAGSVALMLAIELCLLEVRAAADKFAVKAIDFCCFNCCSAR